MNSKGTIEICKKEGCMYMKMMKKKIRSLIYAGLGLVLCVLLCGGIGMTAQAEEEKTYDGFSYVEYGDGIIITGYTGDKTELVIPGAIDGKKVVGIEDNAFWGCSNLMSMTIPDSVTWIGERAFKGCSGLTSITIPDSVASIGYWAFSGCSGLTSITVSKENKYYDSRDNCNAIIKTQSNTLVSGCKNTVIPNSVTSIGGCAFKGCSGLTSITIPDSVTIIGYSAFEECSSLTSMTIPDSVTKIGYSAFFECSGLTSITIPDSVNSIEDYAFWGCSGLTSITIPDSLTDIGEYVFKGCSNLVISCYKDSEIYKYAMEYNIPVKLIGDIVIPGDASGDDTPDPNPTPDPDPTPDPTPVTPDPTPTPTPVTKPAAPAKKGTTLTVSSKKIKVKVTSSSKKNPTVTITKFTDKKAKKLTIPATVKVNGVTYKVTAIADKAFKGNKKLTTVTIGSNVTKIGKEAFSGCKNLKKITVTAGKLKTISKNAFKGINKKATITVKGTKKAKTALKKKLKKNSIGYVKTWKIK